MRVLSLKKAEYLFVWLGLASLILGIISCKWLGQGLVLLLSLSSLIASVSAFLFVFCTPANNDLVERNKAAFAVFGGAFAIITIIITWMGLVDTRGVTASQRLRAAQEKLCNSDRLLRRQAAVEIGQLAESEKNPQQYWELMNLLACFVRAQTQMAPPGTRLYLKTVVRA